MKTIVIALLKSVKDWLKPKVIVLLKSVKD